LPVLHPAGVAGGFVAETGPASGACVVLLAQPAAFPAVEADWDFRRLSSGPPTGLFVARPAEGVLNCLSRSIVSTRRALRSAGSSRILGLPSYCEALDAPGDPGIRTLTADLLEGDSVFRVFVSSPVRDLALSGFGNFGAGSSGNVSTAT